MRPMCSESLLQIIRRSLGQVDQRLMGHGERVAIIMLRILSQVEELEPATRSKLCLLGLLHDIGAYKTEEIDDMLQFESRNVWDHAAYGYLYLCHLSPLGEAAQPILFHHVPFRSYGASGVGLEPGDYAGLIHLADRLENWMRAPEWAGLDTWQAGNSPGQFDPYWMDLLVQAERRAPFLAQLCQADYEPLWEELVIRLETGQQDIAHYLSIIAYAIDFRSECTVLHTVTTVSVSVVLAQLMGLSEQERENVSYGALLHDLGKVSTPVEILEKAGPLDPREMEIMKAHVVITREILEGWLDPHVLEIAARHHERVDGSGYPQGLAGEELTLAQRIVAVADVVSALIHQRSYKDSFDAQLTQRILRDMAQANKLDRKVTDTLLRHYDQVMEQATRQGAVYTTAYEDVQRDYQRLRQQLRFQA